MNLRFNSGQGAITCDRCQIIIEECFDTDEWRALTEMAKTEPDWFCRKCSPQDYIEQCKRFTEVLQRYYDAQKASTIGTVSASSATENPWARLLVQNHHH